MQMQSVYIGIASNLGDRVANMRAAVCRLQDIMAVDAVSQLYAAAPAGCLRDDTLLSAVLRGRTTLPPFSLLTALQKIERSIGRRRVHAAQCLIDIDMLLYGSAIIETAGLVVPHPGLPSRAFVLKPLAEIAPNVVHPVLYYTAQQLLQDAEEASAVNLYQPHEYTHMPAAVPLLERHHSA